MTESDPCGVGHPDEARLWQLAAIGARLRHDWYFDKAANIDGDPPDGHVNDGQGGRGTPDAFGFDRCPHPDCVLFRQPVPPPGAVPAAPQDAKVASSRKTLLYVASEIADIARGEEEPRQQPTDDHDPETCDVCATVADRIEQVLRDELRYASARAAAVPAAQDAQTCKRHGDPLVCLACEQEEDSRPEWQRVTPPIHRVTPPRLRGEPERPNESVVHRCSGCGHRWDGPLPGAELCGDCWRIAQPRLHAAVPAAQDDGDPADAILQSVLMLIGLPSYDSAWFNENGDWDIGLLRQHGLDRRITEIRAAEVSAAVPAAQDARPFDEIAENLVAERENMGFDSYAALIAETLTEAYRRGQASLPASHPSRQEPPHEQ